MILDYFLKKPCKLFFTGMNGMTIGTAEGTMSGQVQRVEADSQAHAQNSFPQPSLLKLVQGTNEEP